MPRLTPSIEVRPLAGALWYGIAIVIIVGLLVSTTAGGAAIWVGFWLIVALILYIVLSRVWRRMA